LLQNLTLGKQPLVLVIEGVEKPGNLGAMLRTCDAAGVSAVIICDARCDVFNPNVIRSSVGTVFANQIAVCSSAEAIAFLKQAGIKTFAAELSATEPYFEKDFTGSSAIVVGTESSGLSNEWLKAADEHVIIPMLGQIDSMNVSVSAGVLLYEAVRQRRGAR
jgi:RNA methyltransferase, TrmH family